MATPTQAIETYAESFRAFEQGAAGRATAWLRELRQRGFARFAETGFPTTRDEDWRFTNVSAISQTPFRLSRDGQGLLSGSQVEPFAVPGAVCRLVFVDGRFSPGLSSLGKLPVGIEVTSLAARLARDPEVVEQHLGRYLDLGRDPFCALNTAFLEDGAHVRIGKGVALAEPIHLLYVTAAHESPIVCHPRNLIVAEENSQATILEEYVSLGSDATLCNAATELVAGDGVVLSHYRVEREHAQACHISTLRVQQGRNANVNSHSVLAGGALVRNNVHPVLAGEGGECLINGLFIGGGRQHLDNYMLVEHASPHCASRQFYNGILGGQARGVFHGRIIVHQDAQKTDARQTNRNLLLSDTAQMDTKPQLEIHADDVKCTHGATIGQIDEEALFYLRSRGIEEVSARHLLLLAFARECLDRMAPGPVHAHVERLIQETLARVAGSSRSASAVPEPAALGESR